MPDVTKTQAIIAALKSAGYQQVTLRVVPKLFQFNDGPRLSELEFSRNYFEEATLATLQALMREKVLPTIKQHFGRKVYVQANGISILPQTHEQER